MRTCVRATGSALLSLGLLRHCKDDTTLARLTTAAPGRETATRLGYRGASGASAACRRVRSMAERPSFAQDLARLRHSIAPIH